MNVFNILLACLGSTATIWLLFWWKNGRKSGNVAPAADVQQLVPSQEEKVKPQQKQPLASNAQAVGEFYDRTNDAFVQVYGEVIQAFRTFDLSNLLNYQAEQMGLQPGMKVLDAGCGVCGPARHFARHFGVSVDAITASEEQRKLGSQLNKDAGLEEKIKVIKGDYHDLEAQFEAGSYDVVYFLESFGHSSDKSKAIDQAWKMLKPGGLLYIKDLFVKVPAIEAHRSEIEANVARINEAYQYHVGDLNQVLDQLRGQGFILSALKTIDIPLQDFENLTISNQFQELTGIHSIDNLQAYLFPVDFFELKCLKPWYDITQGNSRYFLQNLYYLKVHGRSAESL